jgi:hypothetical protein
MRRHSSIKESVSTIVHESSHVRRLERGVFESFLYEEFRAFRREALYLNEGKRPTLAERKVIWEEVKNLYPKLKEGKNPFGKN